jgi:hypothetical protein
VIHLGNFLLIESVSGRQRLETVCGTHFVVFFRKVNNATISNEADSRRDRLSLTSQTVISRLIDDLVDCVPDHAESYATAVYQTGSDGHIDGSGDVCVRLRVSCDGGPVFKKKDLNPEVRDRRLGQEHVQTTWLLPASCRRTVAREQNLYQAESILSHDVLWDSGHLRQRYDPRGHREETRNLVAVSLLAECHEELVHLERARVNWYTI